MILSVVIPTCNRNDLLSNCLSLLAPSKQDINSFDYEIIVSDDSKLNAAKELIENNFNWVKWIEGPKRGPAANRNNGAGKAKGSWLVFLDDDCLPQPRWLNEYAAAISNYSAEYQVLEGKTMPDRPKTRYDEEAPVNLEGGKLWSCNFSIRADVFWELGGFDEEFPFPAMEDVDFHLRIKKESGIKIKFLPTAVIIHPWRRVKAFKSFKKHLKSHAFFSKKHISGSPIHLTYMKFKAFVGVVVYGFKELVSYSFKGWLYYIERSMLSFLIIFK